MTALYLFRIEDGQRIRYKFDVDEHLTIFQETRMPDAAEPPPLPGMTVEVKDGRRTITSVTPELQECMQVFALESPCPAGMEDLRQRFVDELQTLGGSDCPDCTRGGLIRKYTPLIQARMHDNPKHP